MQFVRVALNESAISLCRSLEAADRCIGRNFLIEENVSDQRRADFEAILPRSSDVVMVSKKYFSMTVQGRERGHVPSTFNAKKNYLAIIPMTAIDPAIKFVRLERIDRILRYTAFGFEEIGTALAWGDRKNYPNLPKHFRTIEGSGLALPSSKAISKASSKNPIGYKNS